MSAARPRLPLRRPPGLLRRGLEAISGRQRPPCRLWPPATRRCRARRPWRAPARTAVDDEPFVAVAGARLRGRRTAMRLGVDRLEDEAPGALGTGGVGLGGVGARRRARASPPGRCLRPVRVSPVRSQRPVSPVRPNGRCRRGVVCGRFGCRRFGLSGRCRRGVVCGRFGCRRCGLNGRFGRRCGGLRGGLGHASAQLRRLAAGSGTLPNSSRRRRSSRAAAEWSSCGRSSLDQRELELQTWVEAVADLTLRLAQLLDEVHDLARWRLLACGSNRCEQLLVELDGLPEGAQRRPRRGRASSRCCSRKSWRRWRSRSRMNCE